MYYLDLGSWNASTKINLDPWESWNRISIAGNPDTKFIWESWN